MKIEIPGNKIHENGVIFVSSVLACLATLFIERKLGIGWNFHPDAVTYIDNYQKTVQSIFNGNYLTILGQFYYLVSWALGASVAGLIALNIAVFSLTNLLIYRFLSSYTEINTLSLLLMLLILFAPYRLHLAVHVLKETLLFFSLVAFFVRLPWRYLFAAISFFFRFASVMYLAVIVPNKKFFNLGMVFIILMIVFPTKIQEIIVQQNSIDLNFRDFDQVPTFIEHGWPGWILRAAVWPLLTLSGAFVLFSPSLFFVPIALMMVGYNIWSYFVVGRLFFDYRIYFIMALFALLAPGFTTYFRYVFPLIIILPLLLAYDKRES